MSIWSPLFTYARATSLNVLPSRIKIKPDRPASVLITDARTTPVNRDDKVIVRAQSRMSKIEGITSNDVWFYSLIPDVICEESSGVDIPVHMLLYRSTYTHHIDACQAPHRVLTVIF